MNFTNAIQTKEERKLKYNFAVYMGLNPSQARSLRDYRKRWFLKQLYHKIIKEESDDKD